MKTFDHGPQEEEDVKVVTAYSSFRNIAKRFFKRTRKRNRQEILESDDFRYRIAEQIVDQITDLQWAVLANYVSHGDTVAAGRYFGELTKPIIEHVITWIEEE